MEKCPNCKKIAVEKDQCLACGIIVSRWLKLHSVIPPDTKKESDEELKAVYPHVPPGITINKDQPMDKPGVVKKTPEIADAQSKPSARFIGLEPPDFIKDADATVPISDAPVLKPIDNIGKSSSQVPEGVRQSNQAEDSQVHSTAEKGAESKSAEQEGEKKEKPSFFAQTEADMIRLKKDMKTDWAEYYATRKERFLSGKHDENIATRFRIRNLLISLPLLGVSFFAADIRFIMQFGITGEYSSLHPLIMIMGIVSFFIALAGLATLRPSSVKIKPVEGNKVKIGLHPLQIVEISLFLLLIILLPFKPVFEVSGKSDFPILSESEMKIEFLTGEGLGNFIRPVLGRDGKTIYAVQLYGPSTGYIVNLPGNGSYLPVYRGSRITKFRFLSSDTIVYLNSEGLHQISLNLAVQSTKAQNAEFAEFEEDSGPMGTRILPAFAPSDFDISPDSSKILFCSGGDIWLSERPFTTAMNITKSPTFLEIMPSFFPDNRGFLYIKDLLPVTGDFSVGGSTEESYDEMAVTGMLVQKPKCYQVFSYSFGAKESVRLTDDGNDYYYPLFSPAMNRIAVVVEVKSNITLNAGPLSLAERALVLMNPDASGKIRIFPPLDMPLRAMHEMFWYPDGKGLLVGINALLQKGIYHLSF